MSQKVQPTISLYRARTQMGESGKRNVEGSENRWRIFAGIHTDKWRHCNQQLVLRRKRSHWQESDGDITVRRIRNELRSRYGLGMRRDDINMQETDDEQLCGMRNEIATTALYLSIPTRGVGRLWWPNLELNANYAGKYYWCYWKIILSKHMRRKQDNTIYNRIDYVIRTP